MRVVWAVSLLNFNWTDLQYKMLVASVKSWKKYNPETTTVLYASLTVLNFLRRAGCLDLWDEVVEDLDSYLSGNYRPFTWDYPKVEALYREKQKVLYVDYDIIFHKKLEIDPNKQYCFCEESTSDKQCYYANSQKIPILPTLDKLMVRGKVAYNTGILFLNYETVVKWRDLYTSIVPRVSSVPEETRFCLTIGQACLVPIAGPLEFIANTQGDAFTHFLGVEKYDTAKPGYREYDNILERFYPSSDQMKKALKFKNLI